MISRQCGRKSESGFGDERDGRPSNETASAGLCINGNPRHTVSRNSRCFTTRRPAAFGHVKRIAASPWSDPLPPPVSMTRRRPLPRWNVHSTPQTVTVSDPSSSSRPASHDPSAKRVPRSRCGLFAAMRVHRQRSTPAPIPRHSRSTQPGSTKSARQSVGGIAG